MFWRADFDRASSVGVTFAAVLMRKLKNRFVNLLE
jgi:hypothetical protein